MNCGPVCTKASISVWGHCGTLGSIRPPAGCYNPSWKICLQLFVSSVYIDMIVLQLSEEEKYNPKTPNFDNL